MSNADLYAKIKATPLSETEIADLERTALFSREGKGYYQEQATKAGAAATSYVYYGMEHRQPAAFPAAQIYIDVPLGVARFSKDLILLPKLWNHTLGPIVLESEYERGGHFAAWERPDAIIRDLRRMFEEGGRAHNCITGRSGYDIPPWVGHVKSSPRESTALPIVQRTALQCTKLRKFALQCN